MQAVTWNSGVGAMNTGSGGFSGGGGFSMPLASFSLAMATAPAICMKAMCMRLWTDPRWVSWAPFGKPVVPEV